ncbi:MAG: hypothetical protein V2I56_21370 [Desulfobacteraceae bacterium]|jgi:hypothetical protein|nr:hypothetical protein [Desulfobacteraceae bacterium]
MHSKNLNAENIDHIMASLSDEQVRSLLIDELKKRAQQKRTVEAKPEGIAGFIHKLRNLTTLLHTRMEYLERTAGQRVLSHG